MTKYHFIGIGGIGMSGLARILMEKNISVSGSDLTENPLTKKLQRDGAQIFIGHSAENISPTMTVVYTTGITMENPELHAAKKLGCSMMHRSDLLQDLMKDDKALAVTGTHGKTTTSALLSWVLYRGGLDPSFAVGGVLPQFQSNGKLGSGEYFAAEADESDGSFLKYNPYGAIVTNIGLEHMEFYQTEETLISSFQSFLDKVQNPDLLFWCGDDTRLMHLAPSGTSYGFDKACQMRCSNYRQEGWSSFFDIAFEGNSYPDIEVALTGRHNALNTLAVFGMAFRLGISESNIREALKSFGGIGRRCDKKGEARGITFYDDYAHHPTEIGLTLHAIRQAIKGRRLIAVFQPHRFTRTRDCFGFFGSAFDDADKVIITDIYPAGEAPIPGVNAEKVVSEIQSRSQVSSHYISHQNLVSELSTMADSGDVVVTLGAGSITKVGPEVITSLQRNGFNED